MKALRTLSLLAAGLSSASVLAQAVPAFSLTQADGKAAWTDKTLASTPTLVFLLSPGCPHNKKAAPLLTKLSRALEGKVRVVGVVKADQKEAAAYQKSIGLSLPVICDPQMKLIGPVGGRHSLDFFSLPGGGVKKPSGFWEGYSKKWVIEALKGIKVSVPGSKLDFLPDSRQSGCGF